MGMFGDFLTGVMITKELTAAKQSAETHEQAVNVANAKTAALQQIQNDVLASQRYIARLDDEIRENLPNTFVRYIYSDGWHTWYVDTALSASVTVNKKPGNVREFTLNDAKGIGIYHPFELTDPVGLGRIIAKHIAQALKPPTL